MDRGGRDDAAGADAMGAARRGRDGVFGTVARGVVLNSVDEEGISLDARSWMRACV